MDSMEFVRSFRGSFAQEIGFYDEFHACPVDCTLIQPLTAHQKHIDGHITHALLDASL